MLKVALMGLALMSPLAVESCDAALVNANLQGQAASKTHQGKVVSVSADKLVMSDKDGKNEHTHMVTAAAKVLLDGKSAKLTDLKKGDTVKVTTSPENVVTMIEVTRSTAPTN